MVIDDRKQKEEGAYCTIQLHVIKKPDAQQELINTNPEHKNTKSVLGSQTECCYSTSWATKLCHFTQYVFYRNGEKVR